jgi:hypothetical protein
MNEEHTRGRDSHNFKETEHETERLLDPVFAHMNQIRRPNKACDGSIGRPSPTRSYQQSMAGSLTLGARAGRVAGREYRRGRHGTVAGWLQRADLQVASVRNTTGGTFVLTSMFRRLLKHLFVVTRHDRG